MYARDVDAEVHSNNPEACETNVERTHFENFSIKLPENLIN